MKHKLQRIKEESRQICTEISNDLTQSKKELDQVGCNYHNQREQVLRKIHGDNYYKYM